MVDQVSRTEEGKVFASIVVKLWCFKAILFCPTKIAFSRSQKFLIIYCLFFDQSYGHVHKWWVICWDQLKLQKCFFWHNVFFLTVKLKSNLETFPNVTQQVHRHIGMFELYIYLKQKELDVYRTYWSILVSRAISLALLRIDFKTFLVVVKMLQIGYDGYCE